ncbi:MAG: AAA family ATPase [Candidatus Bathyarchaeota archaeon]|nr:AAA family ATPase [Candidatus Bathyarchaeota archaeon]
MTGLKILGIVGMPGSGKSVAAEVGKTLGFTIVVMGNAVRKETARRGLKMTPQNLGRVMIEMREEEGATVVAKRSIAKIAEGSGGRIIVEGVRSLAEVEEFRKHFPTFELLTIHASPETRFRRIYKRGRSDDSMNRHAFAERDERELMVGLGLAIAMADHVITSEGTLAQYKKRVRTFLEEYLRE